MHRAYSGYWNTQRDGADEVTREMGTSRPSASSEPPSKGKGQGKDHLRLFICGKGTLDCPFGDLSRDPDDPRWDWPDLDEEEWQFFVSGEDEKPNDSWDPID